MVRVRGGEHKLVVAGSAVIHPDRTAWLAAGGDAFRLDLYDRIGAVAPFGRGRERILATVHPDLPDVGCLADWTGDPDLLRAAEAWLRDRGCRVAHAPKEMCAWFSSWASLGPDAPAPFSWEPVTPAGPWLEAGYAPIQRYVSVLADHDAQIRAGTRAAARLAAQGWRVAPLPTDDEGHIPEGLFHEAMAVVHHLFTAGFEPMDGFAHVPLDVLRAWYGRYRTELDARLTLVAHDPEGQPAGAVLAVPDRAVPERGWFAILALVVLPEHQQKGVGSWLVAACHKAARTAGYRAGVHALIRVQGAQEHTWLSGTPIRSYALLGKEL